MPILEGVRTMLDVLITIAVILGALWLAAIAVSGVCVLIADGIEVVEAVKCERRSAEHKKKQEADAHDNS